MENKLKDKINSLIAEIDRLEGKVEKSFAEAQRLLHYEIIKNRVKFEKETKKIHKTIKTNLLRYVLEGDLLFLLSAPFIYAMILPTVVMDVFVSVYQAICFPIYKIPKVRRAEFIIIDRHKLGYLNALEKLNCVYCAYFNGFIAYVREIAARTEQYWCPIRHSRSVKGTHSRYQKFSPYGDGQGYHQQLLFLRKELLDSQTEPIE